MNRYDRYPGDYIRQTIGLTMEEDGAYNRLLDAYYSAEKPIENSRKYSISRAQNLSEKRATDFVLKTYFVRDGDVWRHKRADEEITKAQPKIEAARTNGKKGGRPPKNKTQKETQQKPSGFPSGLASGNPERKLPSPSPSPTTLQATTTTHHDNPTVEGSDQPEAGCVSPQAEAAIALRKAGVAVTSIHPDLIAAVSEGVTPDALVELAETYPGKSAGYLIAAARRQNAEKAAPCGSVATPITTKTEAAYGALTQLEERLRNEPDHRQPAQLVHGSHDGRD